MQQTQWTRRGAPPRVRIVRFESSGATGGRERRLSPRLRRRFPHGLRGSAARGALAAAVAAHLAADGPGLVGP